MTPGGILLEDICFSYPNQNIFRDFNIDIPASKVSVILGPSGCGKTTLLNIIHGIITPQRGVIAKEHNNTISYLFQEPRLLPWKTVSHNIELILKNFYEQKQRQKITSHYLELIGLSEFANYYPAELSGGMRQRVAIARAFAYPAEIILMDEPFQALDPGLKLNLTKLFSSLWIKDNRTSLFVTHDTAEAVFLGDEIFVLSAVKPSTLVAHFTNPVPREERDQKNPECRKIEEKLYGLLTNIQP
ncbi:MAG: ABC transporter ATP-binding protein [Bacteroidetes bacterium]|nr:MAG: ABC transporter ATP-binding protein [Bacteroidota bacterium]